MDPDAEEHDTRVSNLETRGFGEMDVMVAVAMLLAPHADKLGDEEYDQTLLYAWDAVAADYVSNDFARPLQWKSEEDLLDPRVIDDIQRAADGLACQVGYCLAAEALTCLLVPNSNIG